MAGNSWTVIRQGRIRMHHSEQTSHHLWVCTICVCVHQVEFNDLIEFIMETFMSMASSDPAKCAQKLFNMTGQKDANSSGWVHCLALKMRLWTDLMSAHCSQPQRACHNTGPLMRLWTDLMSAHYSQRVCLNTGPLMKLWTDLMSAHCSQLQMVCLNTGPLMRLWTDLMCACCSQRVSLNAGPLMKLWTDLMSAHYSQRVCLNTGPLMKLWTDLMSADYSQRVCLNTGPLMKLWPDVCWLLTEGLPKHWTLHETLNWPHIC